MEDIINGFKGMIARRFKHVDARPIEEPPILKDSEVEVVRQSLNSLETILRNNHHDFFDGVIYLDTSARPLFYAVDSLLTKVCADLTVNKPQQFFMTGYSTSMDNPDFQSTHYALLDGRDAMKTRAAEILSRIKSEHPKLLVIDDYSCPPKRNTVQEVRQVFISQDPNIEIYFFAFMSGKEKDEQGNLVAPTNVDHFSFGAIDPKINNNEPSQETESCSKGFTYRDESRSSSGVEKPHGNYPHVLIDKEADRKKMKALRRELREIGNSS